MKKTVVGIGEILWDIFPDKKVLGGAPSNFAYHADHLGCEGYAISAIGNDSLGDEVLEQLSAKKLKVILERVDKPTGTVQVTLDDKGVPSYDIVQGVAWDYIPFNEAMKSLASRADAVCFGSLAQRNEVSRQSIEAFLDAVPQSCLKVFDINLRQSYYSKGLIEKSLGKADILKINDEEFATVSKMFGFEGDEVSVARQFLSGYGLQMLVLTKGADGSSIITPGDVSKLDTPKVNVVDTVGAGDSFTAAFTASILCGDSVREAHAKAVRTSAFVCTHASGMPEY